MFVTVQAHAYGYDTMQRVRKHIRYPGEPWCLGLCTTCTETCLYRFAVGRSQRLGSHTERKETEENERSESGESQPPTRLGGDWTTRYRGIGPNARSVRHLWRMEGTNDPQGYSGGDGIEAKKRPPRKLFFSAKGVMDAEITFLEEPQWIEDKENKRSDVLTSRVIDHEEGNEMLLEQFPPDAYDLSEALVRGLGADVKGKRCTVRAKRGTRKNKTGDTVEFIVSFEIRPVGLDTTPS